MAQIWMVSASIFALFMPTEINIPGGQCADNIDPPTRVLIMLAKTVLAMRRIAVLAQYVMGKTAFITTNVGSVLCFLCFNPLLEGLSFGDELLWCMRGLAEQRFTGSFSDPSHF